MSRKGGSASAEIHIYKNIKSINISQENTDSIFLALSTRGVGVQKEFLNLLKKRGIDITDNSQTREDLKKIKNYRPVNKFISQVNQAYAKALITAYIDKGPFLALMNLSKVITADDLRQVEAMGQRDSRQSGRLARGVDILVESLMNQ